jgi:hypothetical protein
VFAAVRRGRMTVPLNDQPDLAEVTGLPWCSIATLYSGGEKLHRIVGPAISPSGRWALPVLYSSFNPATGLNEYKKEVGKLRQGWGLEAALS